MDVRKEISQLFLQDERIMRGLATLDHDLATVQREVLYAEAVAFLEVAANQE